MIKCDICGKEFIPTREWQKTCKEPGCIKENRNRKSQEWRKKHPEYYREYARL
jgi:uncharacterized OB-fold protein